MVMLGASFPPFVRWRDSLASAGIVVIGVEFRNAGGMLGNHPFPAGLNDCSTSARWVYSQKRQLGISTLMLSGASGGGNLSLATSLRAKQEGWLSEIDGVYAMCPHISGAYASKPTDLLSLYENDGYVMNLDEAAAMAKLYTPDSSDAVNPLAWPYYANVSDLEGLPPHFISVHELDPVRDEGIAYFRKLLSAGVSAACRTILGSTHGSDILFRDMAPDTYMETERSVIGFLKSLSQ
jgi:acetyl esterase/lipase